MTQIAHIRQSIFKMTQKDFADLAGVRQSSVSRWERGTPLSHREMAAIRSAAIERGILWNDAWFFEAPPAPRRPVASSEAAA